MLSNYKFISENQLQKLGQKLHWISPNVLTILGIIPQIVFFLLMQSFQFGWAAIVLLASPLDLLDGVVARANNKVTAFGGFLDSTMDRVADFLMIAGIFVGGLATLPAVGILLLTTFLISYTRSRGELASSQTAKFDIGLMERTERIIFIFLVVVIKAIWPHARIFGFTISEFLIWLLVILTVFTFLQRIDYARKKL